MVGVRVKVVVVTFFNNNFVNCKAISNYGQIIVKVDVKVEIACSRDKLVIN